MRLPTSPELSAIAVRKRPKQQRARLMVESILEAGARILEDESHPFTTNHIAERAGVSIGSLYQYFPGADAIMAALIEKHVAEERKAAETVLAFPNCSRDEMMRKLIVGFVGAHADTPRLAAQLHALAPGFGLHHHLASARNAQAKNIAKVLDFSELEVQMSVMAVEGVVLATLFSDPARLNSGPFIDKLYAIALAPLTTGS